MTMAELRALHGVPAKKGMRVIPKLGQFMAGNRGRIMSQRDGRLVVRNAGIGERWRSDYHPSELQYLVPSGSIVRIIG